MNSTQQYGLDNLPYAVADLPHDRTGVVTRVGDDVIDLAGVAAERGGEPWRSAWSARTLNPFMDLGPAEWSAARTWLQKTLADSDLRARHAHHLDDVTLRLPFAVADYVDFFASEHHASNCGRIFRPDSEPLTPNWKHLPIGYHGRSGTVVVSGTDVRRPQGQRRSPADTQPTFGPSIRLDIEAEVGFVVGGGTRLGETVGVDRAEQHIFGVTLLNDWSARDVQAWEYVPLGPFLGKSFATSVSAWVTPLEALSAARIPLPPQEPAPLPHLAGSDLWGLDLDLEVEINGHVVTRPPYALMYWSPAQMLAHMTSNGATLRTGDLFGSGTVSGPQEDQRGCLLELTWGGQHPFELGDGTTRSFLEDGDEVVLRATAPSPSGSRLALGEVRGRVLPAR